MMRKEELLALSAVIVIALSFVVIIPGPSAQEEWSKTYGGERSDGAHSVRQMSDGGYVIAGYTGS